MGRKKPSQIIDNIYRYLERHSTATLTEIVKGCRLNPRTARTYLELLTDIKNRPLIYRHEKNEKSSLFTIVPSGDEYISDHLLDGVRARLNRRELRGLSTYLDAFVLRTYYKRWTRFEGVYEFQWPGDVIEVAKEGAKVDGVRCSYEGMSADDLTDEFKNKSVRIGVIAEDLESFATINDAVSFSRLCIANHVPFLIIPSKNRIIDVQRLMHVEWRPQDLTPACLAVVNAGEGNLEEQPAGAGRAVGDQLELIVTERVRLRRVEFAAGVNS